MVVLTTCSGACSGGESGPSGTTDIVCGDGTSASLFNDGQVIVTDATAHDLRGAAIAADHAANVPEQPVTIACGSADIVPEGFVALGPPVTFGPAGAWTDRAFTLTLPFKAARLPQNAGRRHVRIAARRHIGNGESFFPPVANRTIDDADPFASRVSFRASEMVTYQAVA